MDKFKLGCSLECSAEGTAALQAKLASAPVRTAHIIAFPKRPTPAENAMSIMASDASFVCAVRSGTAQGLAFNRIERWQAVLGGCIFTALSLVSLLVGL